MDISALAPQIAALIGVQPSTLVLLVFLVCTSARVLARSIPDDATGALGVLRRVAAILGAEVSNKITSGVTVRDVARAAMATPPIPQQVEADQVADDKPAAG